MIFFFLIITLSLNIHSLKHHLLVGMKNLRKSSNYNPNSAKTDETSHLLRQYTIDDLVSIFKLFSNYFLQHNLKKELFQIP